MGREELISIVHYAVEIDVQCSVRQVQTCKSVQGEHWPDAMGVQNLSELRRRMGPTPCRLEELMTEGPCLMGVMGVAAEVGGWGKPSGNPSLSLLDIDMLEARFNWMRQN